MVIAAITTYPPSTHPQSNFAYFAINRFVEEGCHVIVLADKVNQPSSNKTKHINIDRCWSYNHPCTFLVLLNRVLRYKPDVIWLNLQYTLFGTNLLTIFTGLLTPLILKLTGYPVVTLLHNVLTVTNLPEMNLGHLAPVNFAMNFADHIGMWSVRQSDAVITMVKSYQNILKIKYGIQNTYYVEQDLYPLSEPVNYSLPKNNQIILTLGYYGTYKKLETLIDAFCIIKARLPKAKLLIAGRSHNFTPNYLKDLQIKYSLLPQDVVFLGYVLEDDVKNRFLSANIIVSTATTDVGSSSVLRYAAANARGLVLPDIPFQRGLIHEGWGIRLYQPNDVQGLANVLIEVLSNQALQEELGMKNYRRIQQSGNEFTKLHMSLFRELA